MRMLVLLAAFTLSAHAQWAIQDAHTTADLRGIDNVGGGVAWASGTNGTVLRTEDAGFVWQLCATPPGAEKLDFRGIQAFDNNTAIVMSSGKGDLSRLYKTSDGCQTWKLVFTNPDVDGFWDAYVISGRGKTGILIGDPVQDRIAIWRPNLDTKPPSLGAFKHRPKSKPGESEFAASNSALFVADPFFDFWIGTGGVSGSRVIRRVNHDFDSFGFDSFSSSPVPIGQATSSSGIFSLSFRAAPKNTDPEKQFVSGIAVGGDYLKPSDVDKTAAFTTNGGNTWAPALNPPHGYRSAVAYDAAANTWITVGPNGTDISTDDGRNWRPLRPLPGEAPDTDQHWNALSLPFVVGPKGRIGVLETQALKPK
jgi:hypothetical protein